MKPTPRILSVLTLIFAAIIIAALAVAQVPPPGGAQTQTPPTGQAPRPQAPPIQPPPVAPVPPPPPAPASGPVTTAESTDYKATSTYAEVLAFVRDLQKLSPLVRVETICTSAEGRDIPLLVIGKPLPEDPLALRYDKRVVVYFQANIHAGEVEGKESALMLARDIVLDPKLPYLDKIVLLIAPIFNADGNDKMDPRNRRGQVGPEKGSGVRHNGQNLDLNRDAMKLESPEIRGLVRNVLRRWDPLASRRLPHDRRLLSPGAGDLFLAPLPERRSGRPRDTPGTRCSRPSTPRSKRNTARSRSPTAIPWISGTWKRAGRPSATSRAT